MSLEQGLNTGREEVQEIGADEKLDGGDLRDIDELLASVKALEEHKNSPEYGDFLKDLRDLTSETLEKGYNVYSEADYAVLRKMISLTHPEVRIPTKAPRIYSEHLFGTGTDEHKRFRVTLEDGNMYVYNDKGKPIGLLDHNGYRTHLRVGLNPRDTFESNNNEFDTEDYAALHPTENENISGAEEVVPAVATTEIDHTQGGVEIVNPVWIEQIRKFDALKVSAHLNMLGSASDYASIKIDTLKTALIQRAIQLIGVNGFAKKNDASFVDGVYGTNTQASVKNFQELVGFSDTDPNPHKHLDGKAGKETIKEIIKYLRGNGDFRIKS